MTVLDIILKWELMELQRIYSGVQSINNVCAIVNKVENVLVNTYIFDLIDNGVYVVYALYSSICNNANFNWKSLKSQKMQASNTFGKEVL